MTTIDVDRMLAQQVERHRVLKLIVQALEELAKKDEDAVEWVMERLNED